MKTRTLLLCLILLCGTEAEAIPSLELLEFSVEGRSFGGIEVTGRVENVGDQILDFARISLLFKKEGKILAIEEGLLEGADGDLFRPGEIAAFRAFSDLEPDDYDEITHRFAGRPEGLPSELIEGDLEVPEVAFNIIKSSIGSEILGEAINRTNAVIGEIEIRFLLFDAEGDFLGEESYDNFIVPELNPGEAISFNELSRVAFEEIASWQIFWTFVALRIPGQNVATGVAATTWGRLKLQTAEGF